MKTIAAVSALSLLALPLAAQESMAQAAERQKKARKGQTKVITEDELRNVKTRYVAPSVDGAAASAGGGQPAAPGAAPVAKVKSDDEQRAEKKADIDKQVKQWTDFIADTKKAMDRAQLELNDLSSATFGDRRAGLQKILDEGNQFIAEAQKRIAELEEQARRAGIVVSR
jgi:hypothetical protein